MKLGKKIVAVLMVMLTIAMMFPFSVFAADSSTAELVNDDYTVEGTNAFGKILEKTMSNSNADPEDFSITDVVIDGKKATVSFNNEEKATVVIAIYNEENFQMIGNGLSKVEALAGETEIYIDINEMPKYYFVKGFMLDENNKALCKEYFDITHTKAYEESYSKTIRDFDKDLVLNLDEDETNNFFVISKTAKEIKITEKENILVSVNEDKGEYKFKNINSQIKNLKKGDIFFFGNSVEDINVLKVKEINITSNIAVIVNDDETKITDLFDYMKVDLSSTGEANNMSVDMAGVESGVNFEGFEQYNESTTFARRGIIDETLSDTISAPVWSFNKKFNSYASVKGSVKVSLSFNTKIYYDASLSSEAWYKFWTYKFEDYFYFHFKITPKVKGEVSITGAVEDFIYLGCVDFVTPAGITLGVGVRLMFKASGAITFEIAEISMCIGTKYDDNNGGFTNLSTPPKIDIIPSVKGEVTASIGLRFSPNVSLIKVLTVSLNPEIGVKAKITLFNTDSKVKHLCDACFPGTLALYFDVEVAGEVLKKKILAKKLCGTSEAKIGDFYINSYGFNWGSCPNLAYKVDFKVKSESGLSISDATIASGATENVKKVNNNSLTVKTNSSGEAAFYYTVGTYTASASADKYENESNRFWVIADDAKREIVFTLSLKDGEDEEKPEEPDTPDDPPVVPGKITWSYNPGTKTLNISGSGDMEDYWSYTDAPWHQHYLDAETIKMSEGITRIGDYAFAQFRKVSSVKIPSTVKSIGEGAFYGCERIPEIVIGDKVETIGDYAFYYCATATELEIGKSVKTIGSYAFAQCVALTDVTVPSSVNSIGDYAFAWDKNIVRIAILNPACKIYNSSDVIPSTAIIAGYSGSTAQTHADRYGHTFSKIVLMDRAVNNGIATAAAIDYNAKKRNAKCGNTIDGEYYIVLVLNTALNGSNFTTDQLLYIDQITADASGKIECTFIPRTSEDCKVYVIGDFSDGSNIKEVSTEIIYVTENCSCNCHKNGIAKFFFKLILFFQKIFRTNKECKCGMPHY